MSYTMKEGQGSLFKNLKKESPTQPDMYGSVMINGKEMRIAAWKKEGKSGPFLSIQLSENDKTKSVKTENVQNSSDELLW